MNTIRTFFGKPRKKFRHDFGATSVTTAAWVELVASMDDSVSAVEIFNSSGAILKLSTGTAGNEDSAELEYYVLPNGSFQIQPIELSKGGRLSAKAVGSDATNGDLILNFLG